MDLRLPSFVEYKYYRVYPDPEKYHKSKIMFIIMNRPDDLWSEFEKLVTKHGPEYQYKTDYIRELAGHSADGALCDKDSEHVTMDQTLLWYLVERELFDLAVALIKQYDAKITFSIKKFVRKRIRDRRRNRGQKDHFIESGYKVWPEGIDMDDKYEPLVEFADKIGITDFCTEDAAVVFSSSTHCKYSRLKK